MNLNPIATVDPAAIGLSQEQIEKWERISKDGKFTKDDYPTELRDTIWDETVSLQKINNGKN